LIARQIVLPLGSLETNQVRENKMISRSNLPALVALSFLVLTAGASAQTANSWGSNETAAQTVTRWGLTGTWAADCSTPIDQSHERQTYRIDASGRVLHAHDYGNHSVQYEIVRAAISEAGILGVQEVLQGKPREYGYARSSDGSLRVMYNRGDNDEYSVKDGVIISNGKPTIMQYRCN
jgi:hypothetical protein